MRNTQQLGQASEDVAVRYLQKKGFTIIKRNYRYKKAEIDIIAQSRLLLLFVEVKARSSLYFGYPEAFVTPKKRALVRGAAEEYILTHNWNESVRFDIIAVLRQLNTMEIMHFEDAF